MVMNSLEHWQEWFLKKHNYPKKIWKKLATKETYLQNYKKYNWIYLWWKNFNDILENIKWYINKEDMVGLLKLEFLAFKKSSNRKENILLLQQECVPWQKYTKHTINK